MPTYLKIAAPVSGALRLHRSIQLLRDKHLVEMIASSEGFLIEVRVATRVDEKELPKFAHNADSRTLHIEDSESATPFELEERLRSVEGAFAILGLKKIDFSRLGAHWYRGKDIFHCEETIFQYDTDHSREGSLNPIIPQLLAERLLRRALEPTLDPFGLSFVLFKQGWDEFCSFHYLKSIWFFSFFVEHAFANGEFRTKKQSQEYAKSGVFAEALAQAKDLIAEEIRRGDISKEKAEELIVNKSVQEFARWITEKRGFYLHQSNKQMNSGKSGARWHPSSRTEVKDDAICLATFSRAASAILFEEYCGPHQL